jgi:hypothetical protein
MFGRGRLGERRQTQDCTKFKLDLEVESYGFVTTPVTQGNLDYFILFLFRMSKQVLLNYDALLLPFVEAVMDWKRFVLGERERCPAMPLRVHWRSLVELDGA